jgi:hypothetical protein
MIYYEGMMVQGGDSYAEAFVGDLDWLGCVQLLFYLFTLDTNVNEVR